MAQLNFAHLADRGVVRIAGEDAHHFLQNLITADLDEIDAKGAGFAALLTPQGKILFDFLIVKTGTEYLLDAPLQTLADLIKRLGFYRLRAKVDIEDISGANGVVAAWGGNHPETDARVAFQDPRVSTLGARLIGDVSAIVEKLTPIGTAGNYAAHRIALGVPESLSDFAYSDIFPHDADMDELNGVSFTKGCYVGQEVVSRVHHRGTARKRFVSVASSQPLPEPGTAIESNGKTVGSLGTSAAIGGEHRALGLVRLDKIGTALNNNSPLMCGGVEVRVELPAWARFSWPETAPAD